MSDERKAGAGLAAANGSALPDPKQMTPEYLVDLALQKYACACSMDCSKELHEWAMTLKAELLRRVADGAKDKARLHWLHDCSTGQTDAEGCEWGIYRVKWENGRAVEVWQTNSDLSDLDAEMAQNDRSSRTATQTERHEL
jgi:hypothetical protein